SVGKRYNQPLPFSFSFSFLINSCASSHDTISTGNSLRSSSLMSLTRSLPPPSRENQLGFLPIRSCHWPCVTVWMAISKSSLISVLLPLVTNPPFPSAAPHP